MAAPEAAIPLLCLVSAGVLTVGLTLLAVALPGIRWTVTVDPISERVRGRFRLTWTRSQALAQVRGIEIKPEAWSYGPMDWWVDARSRMGRDPGASNGTQLARTP